MKYIIFFSIRFIKKTTYVIVHHIMSLWLYNVWGMLTEAHADTAHISYDDKKYLTAVLLYKCI